MLRQMLIRRKKLFKQSIEASHLKSLKLKLMIQIGIFYRPSQAGIIEYWVEWLGSLNNKTIDYRQDLSVDEGCLTSPGSSLSAIKN